MSKVDNYNKEKVEISSKIKDKTLEKKKLNKVTQSELIFSYFLSHPNKEIKHPEVVDWATGKYRELTGEEFRDPDRAIRKLYQSGKLKKVKKGIYKYDPSFVGEDKTRFLFSQGQKKEILELGDYKCAICGKGEKEGVELHVDHILSLENGGENNIENGQVLCAQHNFLKKTFNQTETGKRFFINLRYSMQEKGYSVDANFENFVDEILELYDKYEINGHIVVNNKKRKK